MDRRLIDGAGNVDRDLPCKLVAVVAVERRSTGGTRKSPMFVDD